MIARSRLVAFALLASACTGCLAHPTYRPTVVARGELTVSHQRVVRVSLAGQEVARAPTFRTLPELVACVPEAHEHAVAARTSGRQARIYSILGAVFGLGATMGFAAIADDDNAVAWLLGALGSGVTGLGFAYAGHREKGQAVGHALDAVNFYDDGVGSLGATCADLRYPEPIAPIPTSPRVDGPAEIPLPPPPPPSSPDASNARPTNGGPRPILVFPGSP